MSRKEELDKRRAGFMSQTAPDDRFARASAVTESRPTGTSPRLATPTVIAPSEDPGAVTVVAQLSDVVENPLNARHSYKEQRISDLAASIAQRGQLTPALACLVSDLDPLLDGEPKARAIKVAVQNATGAKYLLLGGHYRKKALAKLDKPIELKLVTVRTLLDLYALSYAENDEREDTTPLDDALSWHHLLEQGIASTQEDISRVTNKPRVTIVKTLALLKLPADVQEVLKEAPGRYSYIAAYTLTQLVPHLTSEKLLDLAQQIVAGTVSTRDLEASLAAATADAPSRKKKEVSRQHKLIAEGVEIGVIKEWDSGRVLLDIKLGDQVTRENLVAEIRKRFGLDPDAGQLQPQP